MTLPLVSATRSNPRNKSPGDVGLQPSALGAAGGLPGSLRVPAGCVARWGRRKVLSMREQPRREIDLGAAELGGRFGTCEGCSVHPRVSPPQELPRERWDDREELRGEEERGALLVSRLAVLPFLPCDVRVEQGHVRLCCNCLSRKRDGFSFFPQPLVHGVLIRRILFI